MLLGGETIITLSLFVAVLFISTDPWVAAICRPYSDVMEKYKDKVIGACIWNGISNEEPMFGCSGKHFCFQDGEQIPKVGCVGSLMVLPGCTLWGFKEHNFKDNKGFKKWSGPQTLSRPGFNEKKCLRKYVGILTWLYWALKKGPRQSYFGSLIVTCENLIPDCTNVTDRWETVGEFDNTQSSDEGEFTLTHKTGATIENEFEQSLQASGEKGSSKGCVVPEREEEKKHHKKPKIKKKKIKSSALDELKSKAKKKAVEYIHKLLNSKFSSNGGLSTETGFNWTTTSTRTSEDATEYHVQVKVPAKQRLVVQKAVAYCGRSTVHTHLYRALTFNTKYSGPKKDAEQLKSK